MPSPFPPSNPTPGSGTIHLTLLPPSTPTYTTLRYTYPLKLVPSVPHTIPISPQANGDSTAPQEDKDACLGTPAICPLVFMMTYGGGLLAGDSVYLSITLDKCTRLAATTQGMTKIFRPATENSSTAQASSSPSPAPSQPVGVIPASQTLSVYIFQHAALWLAPDPVQPFADSQYVQKQIFEVERGGSIGLVDWVVEGRKARGESWACQGWRGKNEVWDVWDSREEGRGKERTDGGKRKRMLVRDAVVLEQPELKGRMNDVGVFGTVILRGPLFSSLGVFFVNEFEILPRIGGRDWGTDGDDKGGKTPSKREQWRKKRVDKEKRDRVLWTACLVRGCTVVKFMAPEVEGAREWLGEMLKEDGSIGREFGPGGLMFVR